MKELDVWQVKNKKTKEILKKSRLKLDIYYYLKNTFCGYIGYEKHINLLHGKNIIKIDQFFKACESKIKTNLEKKKKTHKLITINNGVCDLKSNKTKVWVKLK